MADKKTITPALGSGAVELSLLRAAGSSSCPISPDRGSAVAQGPKPMREAWLTNGVIPMAKHARRVRLFIIVVAALSCSTLAGSTTGNLAFANSSTEHRVVILIDSEDEKIMGHAISYSMNMTRSYAQRNETVKIEIVANGSGIKLFRADTSPLQEPLASLRQSIPDIVFSMCDSSRRIAEQREGHAIDLVPGARLVPFGIGRVVDLEEAGWSYIHG
jgi:intracellular sulfur oxidation DsrE/DsrF family protein